MNVWLILAVTFLLGTLVLGYFTWTYYREARHLEDMLDRYLPLPLVNRIKSGDEQWFEEESERRITALFADIAGFTQFSERQNATTIAEVIRSILDELTDCIDEQGGVLDKYVGDALVAEFGILGENNSNDPVNACLAAHVMQGKMYELKQEWLGRNQPLINIRIGVHTGDAAVGHMGSKRMSDFTAIGDTMNLAARLEKMNKYYDTNILISLSTQKELDDRFVTRKLDRVVVKGRTDSTEIY
ncbi:MAG: adenylate/guanylate cyclase domain-containing protein, partial [bacterium]